METIARHVGINQCGADVVIDDNNEYYVLELNDSMGISGPLLEKQQVPYRYAQSHSDRILAQKALELNRSSEWTFATISLMISWGVALAVPILLPKTT